MSASEVAPNPFWYAKPTAALTSRDRLSICVLAMFVHKSVHQLSMTGIGKPVKSPACDVLFSVFFKRYTMKLDLSAGTHYSVLRVPIWQDEWLNPLAQGLLLDFAVIWDEDH